MDGRINATFADTTTRQTGLSIISEAPDESPSNANRVSMSESEIDA
jgi:hypothetical protein